ncbi:ATPase [Stutzerimonas stutzeri]|nr:ATPase [Stutzerimonas stutzeri]
MISKTPIQVVPLVAGLFQPVMATLQPRPEDRVGGLQERKAGADVDSPARGSVPIEGVEAKNMKIERFEDLIDWTRDTHRELSRCLRRSALRHEEQRAQWLLAYLADHEKALTSTIERVERHADPKALHTWVYDYVARNPVIRSQPCAMPYATMSVEEISRELFTIHNQVMDLYRSLARRAEIDGARELASDLLALESHETMRLAVQFNRVNEV